MNRPPDKIFLHWETADVWWLYPRRQNDNDIEYIYFPQLVEGNYDLRQKNKDLQAENERYREALKEIMRSPKCNNPSCTIDNPLCNTMIAVAALKGGDE